MLDAEGEGGRWEKSGCVCRCGDGAVIELPDGPRECSAADAVGGDLGVAVETLRPVPTRRRSFNLSRADGALGIEPLPLPRLRWRRTLSSLSAGWPGVRVARALLSIANSSDERLRGLCLVVGAVRNAVGGDAGMVGRTASKVSASGGADAGTYAELRGRRSCA